MNLRRVVYPFTIAVVLVVFQPHGKAETNVEESRDLQESIQAARQSVASIFSGLLESILAAQAGNPVTSEPQYKLVFSVGAGGKVIDTTSGFECESECEVALEDVLRATYEVIPDEDYQFAGWSGDICNGPETRLNSACDVTVGWSKIGAADELQIRARFARKANTELAGSTAEFEISNYGFGSLFTDETKPVTCYPTPDNCSDEGEIAYIVPGDSAQGDFNRDGYQDLLIMEFMSYGYVRDQKANPTIYLNDQQGGLYRSDSIFAEGFPVGMDFGYRIAVEDFNSDGFDDFFIAAMGTLSQEPRNRGESVFERYILYLSGPDGKLYDWSDQIEGQENGAVLPDMGSHHLAAGDIDGDGDVDIFIWPGLILNDGQGNFSTSASWHEVCQCRDGTMSAIIDDFDGDGMGDLVMFPQEPVSTGRLFLSRGEGDLASRQMTMLPEGYFGHANTKYRLRRRH
ncbi:MAG: VCBS repeat-containing protein [Gammaproteobacteria bacterium]